MYKQKGAGEKAKGEEEDDDEDSLDWWSRYYETVKDIERQEDEEEAKEAQKDIAVTKKDKKGEKEAEAPKRKKLPNPKITRIKVSPFTTLHGIYMLLIMGSNENSAAHRRLLGTAETILVIRYLGMFKLFSCFVSCSIGMSFLISRVFAFVFVVF